MTTNMTLVLGGTGTTGRRVVKGLAAHGVPVRVGSRSGTPPFDWNDDSTWAPVLEQVTAVYLVYYPDLVAPGAVDAVGCFAEWAVASGARRLVLLSGRGEEQAQSAEQVLMDSVATWTVVRSAFFAQNFSETYFVDSVRSGVLALPVGDVGEPFINVDDVADVVVAALTEDGHEGQLYEVTGPDLLSYQQISTQQFVSALTEEGMPDDLVAVVTEVLTTVLDGRNAYVTNGVHRALGRQPRDFADFARTAAAIGAWTAA